MLKGATIVTIITMSRVTSKMTIGSEDQNEVEKILALKSVNVNSAFNSIICIPN